MRTLAIVLLLGLAAGLALLGFYGGSWKLLLAGVPAAIVLHWMIWHEEIRGEWSAGHYAAPLLHLGRDVFGVTAAWGVGHFIFLLFIGII